LGGGWGERGGEIEYKWQEGETKKIKICLPTGFSFKKRFLQHPPPPFGEKMLKGDKFRKRFSTPQPTTKINQHRKYFYYLLFIIFLSIDFHLQN
jgi:hypothetical protein